MGLNSWSDLLKESDDTGIVIGGLLPEGTYDFKVNNCEACRSGNDNRMWKLTCVVESGPQKDQTFFTNVVLSEGSPKSLPFFFNKMEALGITRDYLKTNPADLAIANKIKGARFKGVIGIKKQVGGKYDGRENNELKRMSRLSGSPASSEVSDAVPSGPPAPPMSAAPAPAASTDSTPPPPPMTLMNDDAKPLTDAHPTGTKGPDFSNPPF